LKKFQFRDARPEDEELLNRLDPARSKSSGGGASHTDVQIDLHQMNMEAIYNAWSRGEEAETCATEARKAVAIIEAMYESVRKGGAPVDVK
jgi:UDP-N-acetyl-2-amino-2-deoxyglucuronate dehydrogenase